MKKIMIISDTHKNQYLLREAFSREENITHIFHLGDYYEDLDTNLDLIENRQLFRIPGIYHSGYQNGTLPALLNVFIDGWSFSLIHNLRDVAHTADLDQITLHGHTHKAEFKQVNDQYFINPGHLKAEKDRGRKASYLVAELNPDEIRFKFKTVDGKLIMEKSIIK